MIRGHGMTTRGTRLAVAFAFAIAFCLPKRVNCGWPGGECTKLGSCSEYEVEPLGLYAIEALVHRDVGFAYTHGCE